MNYDMLAKFAFQLLALLCTTPLCDSFNILVLPVPARSHVSYMLALAEQLVGRGHQVSLLIGQHYSLHVGGDELGNMTVERYADSDDGQPVDYNYIYAEIMRNGFETRTIGWGNFGMVLDFFDGVCHALTMNNDDLFNRLSDRRFDLAVLDGVSCLHCYVLVAHRLRIPWVSFDLEVDPLLVRVPWLPSFVPHILFQYSDRMSFAERLANSAGGALIQLLLARGPPSDVVASYQRYGRFRDMNDLHSRTLMWFVLRDNVLDYPRPSMPNLVDVGGLALKPAVGRLPADVEQFVDGAERGAILMTFGSQIAALPADIVEKFAAVFQRLDGYNVIWRLDNRHGVALPDNVMIRDWVPQNDLLAHPRVRLFITHCGLNGQFEAVYHGVPMIGFPFYGDEMRNAHALDAKGYGVSMNLFAFTEDELLRNIVNVLSDDSYRQRVGKASQIFRSQSQTPAERAGFWIEHVCRFGGEHLRSGGNELPVYAYLMLDILSVVLASLVVVIYVVYRVVVCVLGRCCRRRGGKSRSEKIKVS